MLLIDLHSVLQIYSSVSGTDCVFFLSSTSCLFSGFWPNARRGDTGGALPLCSPLPTPTLCQHRQILLPVLCLCCWNHHSIWRALVSCSGGEPRSWRYSNFTSCLFRSQLHCGCLTCMLRMLCFSSIIASLWVGTPLCSKKLRLSHCLKLRALCRFVNPNHCRKLSASCVEVVCIAKEASQICSVSLAVHCHDAIKAKPLVALPS